MNRNPIGEKTAPRGFALLFVLFIVALVIIGASIAVLRIKTEGRREKEAQMIWRGEQYERAIGLYYRKYGRFPTSLDNLVQGTNGIRFLREPYKDPMNSPDGSWRLIYVTPAGILIGSVRYITLQQMAMADRARIMGIQAGQGMGSDNGQGNGTGAPNGSSDQNPNGATPPGEAGGAPQAPPAPSQTGQQPFGGAQPVPPQPSPFGAMPVPPGGQLQTSEDSGEIIGGFIVGVASKIDKPSLKVYKGGDTYKKWEFIYNPLEQIQTFGGGGVPGAKPLGQPPGMPVPQPPQPQPQPMIPQIPQQPQPQNR
jgi:type II secretory pathway pseudopilin PulG